MKPSVAVLTCIPSPYQVELWDFVAKNGSIHPRIIYVNRTDPARNWAIPTPSHSHLYLEDGPSTQKLVTQWVHDSNLFVASWYSDQDSRRLMQERNRSGKPWVFWGERPGFSQWSFLGRIRRRWQLSSLRHSKAPIWGIGKWGVDGWKREFGNFRSYVNIPYFSDLSRFAPLSARPHDDDGETRFLYSGSLIPRKGVDLLAEAFQRLASIRPNVRLEILGAGEMEKTLGAKLKRCNSQVRFSGFSTWVELPAAYHRNDVLIAPSRHDGWGLVVPEALAAGLAVISTDRTGAARDLIQQKINGWMIPSGSVDHLFDAMLDATDLTIDRRRAMSEAAMESVKEHQLEDGARRIESAAFAAMQGFGNGRPR